MNEHENEMKRRCAMQAIGRSLLKDVRRLDLNFREYQIAEMILELSYGWGREWVIVPKLDIFTALTGVARPHVSTNLAAMIEMGLLVAEKTETGMRYSITTDPNAWRCRLKVSRDAVREAITTLKIYNGMDNQQAKAGCGNEDTQGCPHFFEPLYNAHFFAPVVTSSVTVTAQEMLKL